MSHLFSRVILAASLAVLSASLAFSQAAAASAASSAGGQSLDQAADDPTASITSVQVADWYTASYHNLDDESAGTKNGHELSLFAGIDFRAL